MSSRARVRTQRKLFFVLASLFMATIFVFALLFVYVFFQLKHTADTLQDPKYSRATSEMRNANIDLSAGQPISIALFGLDSDAGREFRQEGKRSDTMILATVNPSNNMTTIMSIPRDTKAEIVGHGTVEKINHAYAYGGPKMAIDTLEKFFNMPIDYYATVDMDDFIFIIDNIGGIDVTSPHTFKFAEYNFVAGEKYHMNGRDALAFARSRKEKGSMGDEGRQVRQQVIVKAITDKMLSIESVPRFNQVLKTISSSVTTNIAFQDINKLRKQYPPALGTIKKLHLNGKNEMDADGLWYFIPNEDTKQDVKQQMKDNLGV
ncbi:LCP family protein [Macrococcus animalis]|uniref:LCP family protein n=1 Tax=Macrococcus animalis TaxID=3395467 RepID=UPI0039BEBBCA